MRIQSFMSWLSRRRPRGFSIRPVSPAQRRTVEAQQLSGEGAAITSQAGSVLSGSDARKRSGHKEGCPSRPLKPRQPIVGQAPRPLPWGG